ncbi:MAG: ABC transporter permease subunit [Chloroflexi bacterium]|nr:ABC transporter permease subunit [Chloroflexota bacterium]
MFRLIDAELLKLRRRPMSFILLLVMVGILGLMYTLLLAVSKANVPVQPGGPTGGDIENLLGLRVALPFAFSMLSSFGSMLAVILTAGAMGSEYNWRTIRTAVMNSESRGKLLWAKLVAVGLFVLAGMVAGVIVGFLISLVTTGIGGYKFDFSFLTLDYIWRQWLQFWRTFYTLLPFISLGFMLSIVGRSVIPGIGLGVGVLFLEGIVAMFMSLSKGWIASIPDYLPATNAKAITALSDLPSNFSMGMLGNADLPGATHAAVVLAVYTILFLAISFFVFHNRDVRT